MATQQAASSQDTSKVKQKLQQHLDKAKSRLEQAKQDIANLKEQDKQSIQKLKQQVGQRMEQQKEQNKQVRDDVERWMQERKQQTDDKIASWRQKREIKHLQRRADDLEEYAVNAVAIAIMDADEAEVAVLDAIDARLDAEAATIPS